jgi:hypothetical protein
VGDRTADEGALTWSCRQRGGDRGLAGERSRVDPDVVPQRLVIGLERQLLQGAGLCHAQVREQCVVGPARDDEPHVGRQRSSGTSPITGDLSTADPPNPGARDARAWTGARPDCVTSTLART